MLVLKPDDVFPCSLFSPSMGVRRGIFASSGPSSLGPVFENLLPLGHITCPPKGECKPMGRRMGRRPMLIKPTKGDLLRADIIGAAMKHDSILMPFRTTISGSIHFYPSLISSTPLPRMFGFLYGVELSSGYQFLHLTRINLPLFG